ncbi:hypothetical protein BACI9J_840001 [Bacillus altitudinis]|nr:hypothetical protein BACI9J_840001 [Bacillus altitudinis]
MRARGADTDAEQIEDGDRHAATLTRPDGPVISAADHPRAASRTTARRRRSTAARGTGSG